MSNVLAEPTAYLQTDAKPRPTRAQVHARIAPFAKASSFHGYKAFAFDIALYALGIAAVLFFDGLVGKIAGGLLSGAALVNLGALSHEAAHRALVKSRLGNKVIAVVSMTISLFNYRLWVYDHHVLHHGRTNVKGNNFLSPITLAEYRAKSPFKRWLYRAYHSPSGAGILLYFLIERWPTVHFRPGSWLPPRFRPSAWRYTALMTAYAAALVAALVLVPSAREASVVASVLCGFVLPLVIWYTVFSGTVFLQHTNPKLRWYGDIGSLDALTEELSVHVGVPQWLNHLSHYAMEHPVHHFSVMVPHYRLKQAQAELADVVAPSIIFMPFTLANLRDVLERCRLYDYQAHLWLDFTGEVTAVPIGSKSQSGLAVPDEGLLPDQLHPDSPGIFFPDAQRSETREPAVPDEREDA